MLLLDNTKRLAAQAAQQAGWAITLGLQSGDVVIDDNDMTQVGTYSPAAPYDSIDQTIYEYTHEEMVISFRPDTDGLRQEIVIMNYRDFMTLAPTQPAYTVEVRHDGDVIETVNLPVDHYGIARFRLVYEKSGGVWSAAANRHRPVVATVSTLISEGKLPPYGDAGLTFNSYAPTLANFVYTIMGASSIDKDWGSGGEKAQIGPVTEHNARAIFQALSLAGGHADAEAISLHQGEASGSIPWHWRDAATGKPASVEDHPNKSAFQTGADDIPGSPDSGWGLDTAHQPGINWYPYLLTGDLYFLEELNNQAAFCILRYHVNRSVGYGLQINEGQTRGFAWTLRTVFQASLVAPATEAADTTGLLLPAEYFNTILLNTHEWFTAERVDSVHTDQTVFRRVAGASGPNDRFAPFEHTFLAAILGWAVQMGFTGAHAAGDWDTVLTWQLDQINSMTESSGTGWPRWVSPYKIEIDQDGTTDPVTTWADAYTQIESNVTWDPAPPSDPHNLTKLWTGEGSPIEEDGPQNYTSYRAAACAMAVHLGKTSSPNYEALYDWLKPEIVAASDRRVGVGDTASVNVKWSWAKPAV